MVRGRRSPVLDAENAQIGAKRGAEDSAGSDSDSKRSDGASQQKRSCSQTKSSEQNVNGSVETKIDEESAGHTNTGGPCTSRSGDEGTTLSATPTESNDHGSLEGASASEQARNSHKESDNSGAIDKSRNHGMLPPDITPNVQTNVHGSCHSPSTTEAGDGTVIVKVETPPHGSQSAVAECSGTKSFKPPPLHLEVKIASMRVYRMRLCTQTCMHTCINTHIHAYVLV
jgi:hypothetical protein